MLGQEAGLHILLVHVSAQPLLSSAGCFCLAALKLIAAFQHSLKLRCSAPKITIFGDGSHMFGSKRLAFFGRKGMREILPKTLVAVSSTEPALGQRCE